MKSFKYNVKCCLKRIIMFFLQKLNGIDKEKIVFCSFGGTQYSDSGKAISETFHQLYPRYKLVWLLNKIGYEDIYSVIPNYVIKKLKTTFTYLKEISTAKVVISNENFTSEFYKSKKQLFIQTWHGDRGFKKIIYDIDPLNRKVLYDVFDNKIVDLAIAGSKFGSDVYRTAFRYFGNVLNEGMPRNDILINPNKNMANLIKSRLNISDEKVLLYAPTFRDNNQNIQKININFNKILNTLQKDGSKWILLLRAHTASSGVKVVVDDDRAIDVTNYPDMADLLSITDFLITDYSSSACDFSLTNKPVILYTYDYAEYKNECRDFKADPHEVGFVFADNENELIKILNNTMPQQYIDSCKRVNKYYGVSESGQSSIKVCNFIIKWLEDNK